MVTDRRVGRGARVRRGASAIGCLVPLLVLSIIGYATVHASDAGFAYWRLRDAMQQQARFADGRTDDQIRTRLVAFVDSMGMPLGARKIKVVRTENRITISADYEQTIDFPFISKRFDFHPKAERRF